jgi:hypothetical protein
MDTDSDEKTTREEWLTFCEETLRAKGTKKGEKWLSRLLHTLSSNVEKVATTPFPRDQGGQT